MCILFVFYFFLFSFGKRKTAVISLQFYKNECNWLKVAWRAIFNHLERANLTKHNFTARVNMQCVTYKTHALQNSINYFKKYKQL